LLASKMASSSPLDKLLNYIDDLDDVIPEESKVLLDEVRNADLRKLPTMGPLGVVEAWLRLLPTKHEQYSYQLFAAQMEVYVEAERRWREAREREVASEATGLRRRLGDATDRLAAAEAAARDRDSAVKERAFMGA